MSAADLAEVRAALAGVVAALHALDAACERAGTPTLEGWRSLPDVAELAAQISSVQPESTDTAQPPRVWRVEVEEHGRGVHVVADREDARRLGNAAHGNVWVEPLEVLGGEQVTAMIEKRSW